jgi:hypothetical protein
MGTRVPWRTATLLLSAGLVLSGCASAVIDSHVIGSPSKSISVPLRIVACTSADSCIAVGTSGSASGTTTVGESRPKNGSWTSLVVPAAPSSMVTSSACWSDGCLIGGSQPSGALLWRYDAKGRSVRVATIPHAGQAVSAMSCFGDLTCAAVASTGVTDNFRLSFTSDGATTWSAPQPMTWSSGGAVMALACVDVDHCLATATVANASALVEATSDGGANWTKVNSSTSWISLSSLTCAKQHCVGLASTSNGSLVVRSGDFGQSWTSIGAGAMTSAIACTFASRCVLVGRVNAQTPWLATLHKKKFVAKSLLYVPAPLTDVSCGATICAAIAPNTVLTLRP